ncbi:MAG TPA: cellulose binding domain-containing protein [Polyangiaceae bacterium]|nr:cellulose binding domain-containing protein [Polyangiaceae bacterium]
MARARRSLAVALFVLGSAACSGEPNTEDNAGDAAEQLTTVSTNSVVATLSVNQWNTGYYATVTLKNNGTTAASGWSVAMTLGTAKVTNASNVVLSGSTGNVTATSSADWNRSIPAGGSQSFGFQADGTVRPELTAVSITSGGTGGSGSGGAGGSGSSGAGGSSSGGSSGSAGSSGGTAGSTGSGGVTAPAAASGTFSNLCDRYGQRTLNGYFANNNVWNSQAGSQCIAMSGTVLTVTSANHSLNPNSPPYAPASYPSIVKGCHYGNCTDTFPRQVSAINHIPSTFDITPASGTWDAAYDIWLDPTARRDGANTGLEIMIWLSYGGTPQPIGARTGSVSLAGATWEVWLSNGNENGSSRTISYRRTPTATAITNFDALAFVNDAISRGVAQRAWYITSVQAGFEIWNGGTGLKINQFAVGAQ